jgi:transglutaminase-like putative cysteine protease
MDRQVHAELRQTFVHGAVRLETLQGVHRNSQWRLDFEPHSQTLIIHSICVQRGSQKVEETRPDQFHIVHRESGEDHLDIEGVAALVVLENIRPGDILEWSYTLEERTPLLADHASALFSAPAATPIGRYHFAVRFKTGRPLKWKGASDDLCPDESHENNETTWVWNCENYQGTWLEENTPDWFIDFPWVQVSDCPDWETISTAFAEAWQDDPAEPTLLELAAKLKRDHANVSEQIEHAIQLVQDEFRVTPTDEEAMLQAPTPAATVLRRRFGDGKDVAALLARLLQSLHVTARPVLVNSAWRKSLGALLPMPLFDRAVVEYQVRGETRWVDPTAQRQGGGSLNRIIEDYGTGLPVTAGSRLVSAPDSAARTSIYELKESILLDTSGSPSWLSVNVTASGSHAETLRREFETEGAEAIARQRLQHYAGRFTRAKRIRELEYRDDRAANVFVLAEGFEIDGFLTTDSKPGLYKLSAPNDFLLSSLKMPDPETRRTPFAVPYPCNITHTIEVHSLSLPPGIVQTRNIDNEFVHFNRFRKTLAGDWTIKFTLSTLTDAVPPGEIDAYRESLREIRNEASWSLHVPVGQPRPHQRSDFGRIPNAWQQAAQEAVSSAALPPARTAIPMPIYTRPALPSSRSTTVKAPSANGSNGGHKPGNGSSAGAAPGAVTMKRRKRHRRHRRKEKKFKLRHAALALVAVAIVTWLTYLCIRTGDPLLPKVEITPLSR